MHMFLVFHLEIIIYVNPPPSQCIRIYYPLELRLASLAYAHDNNNPTSNNIRKEIFSKGPNRSKLQARS